VPFTLKDAHATAGVRTTVGFPPFDHVPREDGTVAARLRAAGGILIRTRGTFSFAHPR
jgi:amidase